MKICSPLLLKQFPYLLKFVKNWIWFTFIIVRTNFFLLVAFRLFKILVYANEITHSSGFSIKESMGGSRQTTLEFARNF